MSYRLKYILIVVALSLCLLLISTALSKRTTDSPSIGKLGPVYSTKERQQLTCEKNDFNPLGVCTTVANELEMVHYGYPMVSIDEYSGASDRDYYVGSAIINFTLIFLILFGATRLIVKGRRND